MSERFAVRCQINQGLTSDNEMFSLLTSE